MRTRVKSFVGAVSVGAAIAFGAVFAIAPQWPQRGLLGIAVLCALAIAGELLAYMAPNRVSGSIGYIPYFAAAVLFPVWSTVAAVALVRIALECAARREWIKRVLNTASHTLMEAIAVWLFLSLGGHSLLDAGDRLSLISVSQANGFAAIVAFTVALFANNLVIITAIAIAAGRDVRSVWFDSLRATMMMDLITSPLIFVFAWVYSAFGPVAAAALWVPILGLRQVYQVNLELERTNEELLELMVKSLEARDPYTSGHSRRVQHYSIIIARAIGLSDRETQKVSRAALLHDVGKIYDKYASVLAKQDKLTPEEWAIIQEHPIDGANLVATMSRLQEIVPAIRGHHENWDGTGYPDGFAGDLIPLAARIIRFADTIDAMTTERPYRQPLGEQQVRAEVVACRGTQFDPAITDRLLSSAMWQTLFAPLATEARPPLSLLGEPRDAERGRHRGIVRQA